MQNHAPILPDPEEIPPLSFSNEQSHLIDDQNSLFTSKLYLNKREKLEQKHEVELKRCKEAFELFLEKYGQKVPKTMNFNKVLETVKVPFSSLPTICQIKPFFLNYVMRYLL